MDDEEPQSAARLFIAIAVLAGVAMLLVTYGIGFDDLFIVLFFAYFILSAFVLRKGRAGGQAPSRHRDDDDWGFDSMETSKSIKDDDWGFDFGDDDKEEYKSLIKEAPKERDPYSELDDY